jgi:hypothetical protein
MAMRLQGRHIDAPAAVLFGAAQSLQIAVEWRLECVSKCREMQFRVDLPAFQGDFPQT